MTRDWYKWWIRYVAVPLLTGGGFIAVLATVLSSRMTSPPPQLPTPPPMASTPPSPAPAPGILAQETPTSEPPKRLEPSSTDSASTESRQSRPAEGRATQEAPSANSDVQAKLAATTNAVQWIHAFHGDNVYTISSLATFPFRLFGMQIVSDKELRNQYQIMKAQRNLFLGEVKIGKISVNTIKEVRERDLTSAVAREEFRDSIGLEPTDYLVRASYHVGDMDREWNLTLGLSQQDGSYKVAFTLIR